MGKDVVERVELAQAPVGKGVPEVQMVVLEHTEDARDPEVFMVPGVVVELGVDTQVEKVVVVQFELFGPDQHVHSHQLALAILN